MVAMGETRLCYCHYDNFSPVHAATDSQLGAFDIQCLPGLAMRFSTYFIVVDVSVSLRDSTS